MAANKYRVIKCSAPGQHGPNVSHAVVVRKAVGCIRADYHTMTKEGALSAAAMFNVPMCGTCGDPVHTGDCVDEAGE